MAIDHIFHSDEPVLEDELGHAAHVQRLAEMIMSCTPPFVLGVHGDWGTGKTSFLRKSYTSGKAGGLKYVNRSKRIMGLRFRTA